VTIRAVYRDRSPVARPGMVRRLHIVREDPAPGWEPGEQTLCGVKVWAVQNSDPIILSPMPSRPPEGLSWCPECVGKQAELLGLLDEFAARVAAHEAGLTA
jgi:hypothetical protein